LISGSLTESEYIKATFRTFIKSKLIDGVLREHAESAVKNGDFDNLQSSLRAKAKEFDESKPTVESTFSLLNLEEIYTNRRGIQSGISLIDSIIGGLFSKEMSMIIGDTNVGKSFLATYIGGKAVKQMRKVLHVGLEMSKARNLIRYYTTLADPDDDITYTNIYRCDPEDEVFDYVTRLHDQYESYLKVEEIPTSKCTVDDLYRLLDRYPDTEVMVLDYMDLMQAPEHRSELRHELSDLCTVVRGIAVESDHLHIISPTQANKSAKYKRIVGTEYSAEDYGKMRIVDWAVGMGQNKNDVDNKQVVLSIAKSRNSEKGFAERYFMDFSHMTFRYMGQEVQAQDGTGH